MAKLKLTLRARPIWLYWLSVGAALIAGLLWPTSPGVRGPLLTVENTVLGVVIMALGGVVMNLWGRIGKLEDAVRSAQEDLRTAQADLQTFREENSTLRDTLSAAASFINRVGLRLISGRGPWPQPPTQIAEHIDAELWDDIPTGGTE